MEIIKRLINWDQAFLYPFNRKIRNVVRQGSQNFYRHSL